jgi:hypothetical protein
LAAFARLRDASYSDLWNTVEASGCVVTRALAKVAYSDHYMDRRALVKIGCEGL